MRRAILIFGAGLNQLTLIKAAKELDLISVVIDPKKDAIGKEISDHFYCVSGSDYDTTKEIAIKHNVAGIVTSQMENPMRLMTRLAKDLGFIFHSPEVTERSLDKWLMKQAFIKDNVPHAKGILFNTNTQVNEKDINNLSFPHIIKPRDAHSSRGVYKVDSLKEINIYRERSEKYSMNGEILIEEFLEGPEISVESITYNGITNIVQYTEKFITPLPYTVEMGHLQPAILTDENRNKINQIVIAAINSLGIDNSASHTEIKLTKDGPKIIEIGARLGGDYISSYLVLHSCGVNMDKAAIQVALGIKPDLNHTLNQFSYIKYLELPVGKRVKDIGYWQELLSEPHLVYANIAVKNGDVIPEITDSSKRPGFVIVKQNTQRDILKLGSYYISKLLGYISFYGN